MRFLVRTSLALIALLAVASGSLVAQEAGQIVYIDSERLRQEAPGLQRAATQLQQQAGTMTAGERREQEQALVQKREEIRTQGQQLEQEAANRRAQILGPALEQINQVIQQVRADEGYAYVLDARAGGVLAADPALDITDEVLRRLNAVATQGS